MSACTTQDLNHSQSYRQGSDAVANIAPTTPQIPPRTYLTLLATSAPCALANSSYQHRSPIPATTFANTGRSPRSCRSSCCQCRGPCCRRSRWLYELSGWPVGGEVQGKGKKKEALVMNKGERRMDMHPKKNNALYLHVVRHPSPLIRFSFRSRK